MERQEFLAKLGISLAAVCTGCSLVGCGSKGSDPGPGPSTGGGTPPPTPGSGSVFTVNLDNELSAVGSSKVSDGVILVRVKAGNTSDAFTAVQVACTHQGTNINYNTAQGRFICPNHGSQFSTSGSVLLGPAEKALKHYTVNVEGSTLTVVA